jgi:hypothetical protein
VDSRTYRMPGSATLPVGAPPAGGSHAKAPGSGELAGIGAQICIDNPPEGGHVLALDHELSGPVPAARFRTGPPAGWAIVG